MLCVYCKLNSTLATCLVFQFTKNFFSPPIAQGRTRVSRTLLCIVGRVFLMYHRQICLYANSDTPLHFTCSCLQVKSNSPDPLAYINSDTDPSTYTLLQFIRSVLSIRLPLHHCPQISCSLSFSSSSLLHSTFTSPLSSIPPLFFSPISVFISLPILYTSLLLNSAVYLRYIKI